MRSLPLGLAAASLALSGCVAAALPVVAAAGVAKKVRDNGRQDRRAKRAKADRGPVTTPLADAQLAAQQRGEAGLAPTTHAEVPKVPPEMQFLYGSGEAAALSLQAYQALWNYLHNDLRYRRDKSAISSVVLSRGSTLASPRFDTCGARPANLW